MSASGKISFSAAVLMGLNIMIGAGIFIGPKFMAEYAGSWGFLGWPLVAILLFPIIWNVSQAALIFPGEGGFFTYCSKGLNETAGFLAIWGFFLGYLGAISVQSMVIRDTLIKQFGLAFVQQNPILFYVGFFALLAVLNLVSIEVISRIQSFATVLKIMPLFFGIALIAFYWNPEITFPLSGLMRVGSTIPFAIFAYNGWECCTSIGHMIEGGTRALPRVMMTAFLLTAGLYSLFHLSMTYVMGTENLIAFGAIDFPRFLGLNPMMTFVLQTVIAYAIILIYMNASYGSCVANVSSLESLASRGLVFGSKLLCKKNGSGRPVGLIFLNSIAAFCLVMFIGIEAALIAFTCIGISMAFFFTLLALCMHHWRQKNYTQLLIVKLGFASWLFLNYFNWTTLSPDPMMRFVYSAPLTVGLLAGYVMYKIKKSQNVSSIN